MLIAIYAAALFGFCICSVIGMFIQSIEFFITSILLLLISQYSGILHKILRPTYYPEDDYSWDNPYETKHMLITDLIPLFFFIRRIYNNIFLLVVKIKIKIEDLNNKLRKLK